MWIIIALQLLEPYLHLQPLDFVFTSVTGQICWSLKSKERKKAFGFAVIQQEWKRKDKELSIKGNTLIHLT